MNGHAPVMVAEALRWLDPARGGVYVDCTLGAGGHTAALLEAARRASSASIATSRRWRWRVSGSRPTGIASRSCTPTTASSAPCSTRVGCRWWTASLADLGVSSMQLDALERGFSFRGDAPLDMRMDRSQGPTAADLLREVSEGDLANVIFAVRRRAAFAAHRACADPRPRRGPADDDGAVCAAVVPAARFLSRRLAAHRPGHAHLPGAPDLGQRRARGARAVRARGGAAAARRRAPGRHRVPLARGPHRQAHAARASTARPAWCAS